MEREAPFSFYSLGSTGASEANQPTNQTKHSQTYLLMSAHGKARWSKQSVYIADLSQNWSWPLYGMACLACFW